MHDFFWGEGLDYLHIILGILLVRKVSPGSYEDFLERDIQMLATLKQRGQNCTDRVVGLLTCTFPPGVGWVKCQVVGGGRTFLIQETFTRWWFQIFFIFTPNPGEEIQFDEHIIQRGWFNHNFW